MKKLKEFYTKYKDYVTVDLIMYAVMIIFMVLAVVIMNIFFL